VITSVVEKSLESPRVTEKQLRFSTRLRSGLVPSICTPPNIALQRTPSASPLCR
jgi:hypothetical protein